MKRKDPAYKLGTSAKATKKPSVVSPGPGFYQTIDCFGGKESIKISILAKQKPATANRNPGPGQYQPNFKPVQKSNGNYKVGTGKRTEAVSKEKRYVPGPGQYQSPDKFGKDAPKVSLHSKLLDSNSRNLNPGPGQYNPAQTVIRQRSP